MNTVSILSPWLPQETHLEISIEPTCQAMHLVFGESITGIHASNSHSSHLLSKSYVYSMYNYSKHIYFRTHYLYHWYLNLTCKFWKNMKKHIMYIYINCCTCTNEVVKKLQELLHDLFFVIVFFLPYRFTGDCDYSIKYNRFSIANNILHDITAQLNYQ